MQLQENLNVILEKIKFDAALNEKYPNLDKLGDMKAFSAKHGGENLYWVAFGTDADRELYPDPIDMKYEPTPNWLTKFVRTFDATYITAVESGPTSATD